MFNVKYPTNAQYNIKSVKMSHMKKLNMKKLKELHHTVYAIIPNQQDQC